MPDEPGSLPSWVLQFVEKCGIAHARSLNELTDTLLTHFECRGDPLQPEEAKLLSLLISACAHSLKSADSALKFLNDRRVLDQAAWLAKHRNNGSSVLYPEPKIDELFSVEPDDPPFASLWTLSRKFQWLAFHARHRRRARESKLRSKSQSQQ
jgi:hypothetical protein